MMAISGVLSVYNLKNITVRMTQQGDIFAMNSAIVFFEAITKYPIPSMLIRVSINNSEIILPLVRGNLEFKLSMVFHKRGRVTVDTLIISSHFPFYFFNRLIHKKVDYEFLVYPQPIKCDLFSFLLDGKSNIEARQTKGKAYEGETTGVKSYSPNEPLKYIHWKASAKTSELMTKEFSPYSGEPTVIKLSDFSGDIEQKIGKATYTILQLSKRGIPVGLDLGNRFFKPDINRAHIRRLLYELAVY